MSRAESAAARVMAATAYLAGEDFWDFHIYGTESSGFVAKVHTTERVAAKVAERFDAGVPFVVRREVMTTTTRTAAVGGLHVEIVSTGAGVAA